MKMIKQIGLALLLSLALPITSLAASEEPMTPIMDRENSLSVFQSVDDGEEIPQTSSKTTKNDVINTILFTLGLKVPDQSGSGSDSIYNGFMNWLGSRNLQAANTLDNLTNNYLTTSPYGIGQVFTMSRTLWETLREETEDGINFTIANSSAMPFSQFYERYCNRNIVYTWAEQRYVVPWTFVIIGYQSVELGGYGNIYMNTYGNPVTIDGVPCLKCRDQSAATYYCFGGSDGTTKPNSTQWVQTVVEESNFKYLNGEKYIPIGVGGYTSHIVDRSSGSSNIEYDRFDGRKELSNDYDYNVVGKSDILDQPIWASGDAPQHQYSPSSEIQMNIAKSDELATATSKIENDEADLTNEMIDKTGVAPIDNSSDTALNGLDLQSLSNVFMNTISQNLGDAIFEDAWGEIETFTFSLPSQSFINVALWVSSQMETLLYLTDFNQVFTMICIMIVAASLVGLTRIWHGSPQDNPERAYKKPSREKYEYMSPYVRSGHYGHDGEKRGRGEPR